MTRPATAVDAATVLTARLRAHRVHGPGLPDMASVVGHFLAVQGQELQPALWGTSRRVAPDRRPDMAAAVAQLDAGELLRTHLLRPTWHLVRPDDARWLLVLTGPRVAQSMASTMRTARVRDVARAVDVIAQEVADGPRTRNELRDALVHSGALDADTAGLHLILLLMQAELDLATISGPLQGGRQTYAAFESRVPAGYGPLGETYDHESAVLELWRRSLKARAFTTLKDVQQWCSLTLADLRAGVAPLVDAGEVVEVPGAGELEGLTFYALAEVAEAAGDTFAGPDGTVVDLLQAYDELFCSYRESRGVVLEPGVPLPDRAGTFIHSVAVDGRVAGRWRWPGPAPREIGVQWSRDPRPSDVAAFDVAAAELRDYLGASPSTP
jgi:hypothetical protein